MCVKSSVYSTHVELLLSDFLCATLLLFYWWIFVVVVVVVFFVLCFFWLFFFSSWVLCLYLAIYVYILAFGSVYGWKMHHITAMHCRVICFVCATYVWKTHNTQSPYARSHLHIVRTNTCVDNNQQNKSTHISKSTNSHTPAVTKHSISNIEPGRIQMNGRIIEIHTTMPRSNNEYWSE